MESEGHLEEVRRSALVEAAFLVAIHSLDVHSQEQLYMALAV